MNINYDKDIDYMEIFFSKEVNYGDALTEQIVAFKSEKNDKVVGYSFEKASQSIFKVSFLSLTAKLAAILKIIRATENLTQSEAAKKIGNITLRHYQRLEAGEDTTLEVLERITLAFPQQDFSKILRRSV
jgi:DNA-binding XRE family transcriptional regulator